MGLEFSHWTIINNQLINNKHTSTSSYKVGLGQLKQWEMNFVTVLVSLICCVFGRAELSLKHAFEKHYHTVNAYLQVFSKLWVLVTTLYFKEILNIPVTGPIDEQLIKTVTDMFDIEVSFD